ncbi:hypothetical protein [Caballeronia sp. RCC_10]
MSVLIDEESGFTLIQQAPDPLLAAFRAFIGIADTRYPPYRVAT